LNCNKYNKIEVAFDNNNNNKNKTKMGLLLDKTRRNYETTSDSYDSDGQNYNEIETDFTYNLKKSYRPNHLTNYKRSVSSSSSSKFPDLELLPPELSLQILKNLNPTDLCLAACVWNGIANDDLLWQELCKSTWGYASVYSKMKRDKSYRTIFLQLDEATLTFNADFKMGLEYLFRNGLVDDEPFELAKFINSTKKINSNQKERLFQEK
jgi:hypothetical protein